MGEKIDHTAIVLGYIVLCIIVALSALLVVAIVRYAGKLYNRWKYDSLKRQNAELEWEQIRDAWRMEDRQDEDRNTVDEPNRHDTIDLSDISEQLYNYQEELKYEGS